LVKEKNGIKVFMASVENSKFKNIRVQALMEGTISKLVNILFQVDKMPEWVYKCKEAYILKQITPNEFIYYNETALPWPASNRDAVIRLNLYPDTLHHIVRISAVSEAKFMDEKKDLVRVPYSKAMWYVAEAGNKITIDYTFEVNPGGSLPAWLVNMLADKGPYESFEKLMINLKK
jgi:hypothetical protein